MAIPGVPSGIRRRVIEALVDALKFDPHLANRRVLRRWIVWDGQSPVSPPPVADMPAIQLRLFSGPVVRVAGTRSLGGPMTHASRSTLTLMVDLWVAGTDQGDLCDLADLVYAALGPQEEVARAVRDDRLKAAGIRDVQLVREILPDSEASYAAEGVSGRGAFEVTVFTAS